MDDQVSAFEGFDSRRWQDTVGIRDDTDEKVVLVLQSC